MNVWFICHQELVIGPFNTEELRERIGSGEIKNTALVWRDGQAEWIVASEWMNQGHSQIEIATNEKQEQMWHYVMEGVSKGPMPRSQMIHELSGIRQKDEILVWTKGMKSWVDIFDIHELVDDLGLSRRQFPRANVVGKIVIKRDDGLTAIGNLRTISAGGVGAQNIMAELPSGHQVTIEIKSSELGDPIVTRAIVQYTSNTGFVGLKFVGLGAEAASHIVQHVKQSRSQMAIAA